MCLRSESSILRLSTFVTIFVHSDCDMYTRCEREGVLGVVSFVGFCSSCPASAGKLMGQFPPGHLSPFCGRQHPVNENSYQNRNRNRSRALKGTHGRICGSNELWSKRSSVTILISYSTLLGCCLSNYKKQNSKSDKGLNRLFRKIVSESMYMIRKIRCECTITWNNDPEKTHSAHEIHKDSTPFHCV